MRLRLGAVPCSRPVCVFLIGVPCRLVCFSSLPSLYSDSSRRACRVAVRLASFGRRRYGGAWLRNVGGAVWRWVWRCSWCGGVAVWRVVDRAVGGSVMPCRVAERAVSGTRDGTNGEMRGETGVAPFLSARLGGLSDGGGVVDGCGQEVCRGRGGGVIRMSLLFFSCLSYRIRPGGGGCVCSSRGSVSLLVSLGVPSIPSRCASRWDVSLFVL